MNPFLPKTASVLVDKLSLIPHPEGGFFLETFRSGSVPMASRGQTDEGDSKLVVSGNLKRNALTSIFWVPTRKSPMQPLTQNKSDHVHYYQGGLPFEYIAYNTTSGELTKTVLGPDINAGHVLQLPMAGGLWKCGRQVDTYDGIDADYSLIAEAVGPGFDFRDFRFVQANELESVKDESVRKVLQDHLHAQQSADEIDQHYDKDSAREERAKERM